MMPRLLKVGLSFLCVVAFLTQTICSHADKSNDPHGGVPMGIPNYFCDDGKNFTSIDWNPSSTEEYVCDIKTGSHSREKLHSVSSCEDVAKKPIHVCFPQPIEYDEDIPTSGPHRPLWPRYGEYKYLPPQRWLHSLEHGAIVFLYHPCADPDQVKKFKAIARRCLRRHIITPSKRIPSPNMFALAAWKCKLVMNQFDLELIVNFVRKHAIHSPERSVYTDGQYSIGLKKPAKVVSNLKDQELCPKFILMAKTHDKVMRRSYERQTRLKDLKNHILSPLLLQIKQVSG